MSTPNEHQSEPTRVGNVPPVVDEAGWWKQELKARMFGIERTPTRLGRFIVLGPLGSGGMGAVLRAYDETLDRQVAVKLMHASGGERQHRRMLREAQALARLSHPNVVQVYEVGEVEGQLFIAMELLAGRTFQRWQRDDRPSWRACLEAYVQAGRGLAAAHAAGMIHRDFKPANCIIDEGGRVRVLDFGLARYGQPSEADGPVAELEVPTADERTGPGGSSRALEEKITATGTIVGTLAYMAPEQLRGRTVDARADQFAFCVALYEALYGERPFEGGSIEALMRSLQSGRIRPAPKATTVPEALRRVVQRGLAPAPDDRWPSMDALLAELERQVAPRRRSVWGLGLAIGAAAAAVGIARYAELGAPCEGAQAQLDGVWDEARRQELRAAILGTGVSYAPDTWARVEPHLDAYAQAWVAKLTQACEATSVRKEQSSEVMDLRMECLRRRRVALREAVEVLTAANATRVENAVELVSRLPTLSRCDDVEALRAQLPPPEDPQVAEQVARLRERLDRARAEHVAGEYDQGLALAEDVVARAEPLGHGPLLAEALLRRGAIHDQKGQYAEAERDLERAYLLAAQLGHDEVEAEAVARLSWVVGYRRQRYDAGRPWAKTALALAQGPRVEPLAEALALANVGAVLRSEGKLEEALDHHRRALAIREAEWGAEHPDVAFSLGNIGNVLHAQGKPEEALEHLQRTAAILEEALGPGHPDVAQTLNNIGGVLHAQGRLEEALTHCRRGLEIRERALGARHPHVAAALGNVGMLLKQQGRLEEALEHLQRAAVILEETLGPGHPDLAATLSNIGGVLQAQGKPEEALTRRRDALAIMEGTLGPRHPEVARFLLGAVELELELRAWEAAREHAERAVAIREASETPPERLAEARFLLAQALRAEPQQRGRARALAEQARDAYAALGGVQGQGLAEVEQWLAELEE